MKKTSVMRSYKRITRRDLEKLVKIASIDRTEFFHKYPKWKRLYEKRIICVALCQGAALHYIDGENGIKDFDVWTFYAEHLEVPFPYRRRGQRDFGLSKFGSMLNDRKDFTGRRVDLIGRSLSVKPNADPIETMQQYLGRPRTKSARLLALKAVVILQPNKMLGEIAWTKKVRVP